MNRVVRLDNASGLYYTQIWSKSTKSGHKWSNFQFLFLGYAYIRSNRVENSDPVKFVLVDVQGVQVGEVGQVGELGQCQWVVLHTDLVEVDQNQTLIV